jgi:hypothetical protein
LVQAEIAVSVESEAVRQCGTANGKIHAHEGARPASRDIEFVQAGKY